MNKIKIITSNKFEAKAITQYCLYNLIDSIEIYSFDEFNNNNDPDLTVVTNIEPSKFSKKNEVIYVENSHGENLYQLLIAKALENVKSKTLSLSESGYEIYTVSSIYQGAGKSVFSSALLNLLSKNFNTAKLDFINSKGFNLSTDLSSEMLKLKTSGTKPSILKIAKNKNQISGFVNITDFTYINYTDFLELIEKYNKIHNIEKFIIEIYNPLIPICKDLISNSSKSFVIRSNRGDEKRIYEYINSLNKNRTISFINRVSGTLKNRELPLMSSSVENGFDDTCYKLFISQISKTLKI